MHTMARVWSGASSRSVVALVAIFLLVTLALTPSALGRPVPSGNPTICVQLVLQFVGELLDTTRGISAIYHDVTVTTSLRPTNLHIFKFKFSLRVLEQVGAYHHLEALLILHCGDHLPQNLRLRVTIGYCLRWRNLWKVPSRQPRKPTRSFTLNRQRLIPKTCLPQWTTKIQETMPAVLRMTCRRPCPEEKWSFYSPRISVAAT